MRLLPCHGCASGPLRKTFYRKRLVYDTAEPLKRLGSFLELIEPAAASGPLPKARYCQYFSTIHAPVGTRKRLVFKACNGGNCNFEALIRRYDGHDQFKCTSAAANRSPRLHNIAGGIALAGFDPSRTGRRQGERGLFRFRDAARDGRYLFVVHRYGECISGGEREHSCQGDFGSARGSVEWPGSLRRISGFRQRYGIARSQRVHAGAGFDCSHGKWFGWVNGCAPDAGLSPRIGRIRRPHASRFERHYFRIDLELAVIAPSYFFIHHDFLDDPNPPASVHVESLGRP